MAQCSFEWCDRDVRVKALGLCGSHASQHYRYGRLHPLKAKRGLLPNPGMPGTLLVPLSRGLFAIIDEADGPAVGERNWSAWKEPGEDWSWYAVAGVRKGHRSYGTIKLHRFLWDLWGLPATPEIDHRNTNGLDCRRENLRAATRDQNGANIGLTSRNTSGRKGVSWDPKRGKWVATIGAGGKSRYLGASADLAEAAAMYEQAAREAYGEFARVA